MKKRCGFVSNSSSSSFLIAFHGKTAEDCFEIMRDIDKTFDLSEQGERRTVEDVIAMIRGAVKDVSERGPRDTWEWDALCTLFPIGDVVDILREKHRLAVEEVEKGAIDPDWSKDLEECEKARLDFIDEAMRRGASSVIVVECGDNDGSVPVSVTSTLMDHIFPDVFWGHDIAIWKESLH